MHLSSFRAVATALILALFISAAAFAAPPEVVVKDLNGRPTVFADGKPLAMSGYSTFGERAFKEHVPDFFPHGADVYYISIGMERFWNAEGALPEPVPDGEDTPNGRAGWTVDDQARAVLEGDPDAWLIVRFGYMPPQVWLDANPQELFVNEEGNFARFPTASLASERYWDTVMDFTESVVRYCESRPWSNRLLGYADFLVTEGSHMPVAEKWLFDHGPLMLAKWRSFLKDKYKTVDALRAAYGDPTLTFATVMVPSDKLLRGTREVSNDLYWQPRKNTVPLRDYLELTKQLHFEETRRINETIDNTLDREAIVVYDTFKQAMQGWEHWGFFAYNDIGRDFSWALAFPEFQAGSGLVGVAELFDMPGFDGLITPHDYYARGLGGVYEPEGIVDSMVLRGKVFFTEMDTRTYRATSRDGQPVRYSQEIGSARNDREWAAITWRNMASGLTRGFSSYWMEFGGGWLHNDALQAVIGRQTEVMNESLGWKHADVPGIAMIIDDAAVLETNGNGVYQNEAVIWEWKIGIARCGVPHRKYLLEDIALENFPDHCVFYFPNMFRVDDKKLALLREKVFRNGNVVIWGPGSGIAFQDSIGAAGAKLLTGFDFTMLNNNAPRRVLVTNYGHPVTEGLPEDLIYGDSASYGPILLPRDGEELGLSWTKGGFAYSGLVLKEFGKGGARTPRGRDSLGEGDWVSVFTTAVPLPADLWRNLARYSGAHVYTESNDVIMADETIVALHSVYSGKKEIRLPAKRQVYDVITGKRVSGGTDRIVFDLKAPETRIFRLE